MRVAGIGFRRGTTLAALLEAVEAAGGAAEALATAEGKARAAPAQALARALNLPLIAVPAAALAGQPTPTRSPRIHALFGTGSLAEAAALAAAGPGATLIAPRVLSRDRTASAAIAEGSDR